VGDVTPTTLVEPASGAAAPSRNTQVSDRRTAVIGIEGSRSSHRSTTERLLGPSVSTTRLRAPLTIPRVRVMRGHPLNMSTSSTGRSDTRDLRSVRRPRGGVAVVADAEVYDVEPLRQARAVASSRAPEVAGRHRHRVDPARQRGEGAELTGVAGVVPVGRDALVDLPDAHPLPRHVGRDEAEIIGGAVLATAQRERCTPPSPNGVTKSPGDPRRRELWCIVTDPDVHPPIVTSEFRSS
jgi:hypothetical protein